ncbi:hypothetical protein BH09BAC6_BH09BAC6_17820 [soil metagenome]|jgi:hypothetical protein
MAVSINYAYAGGVQHVKSDTTILRFAKSKSKNSVFKNGLHLVMPPIKPAVTSTIKVTVPKFDDKLLSNVQVYPNPVTDVINVKYEVSRSTTVTIKIMDVLGNDVITIFSRRVESGEHEYPYVLNNRLTRGFYFVRIVAGTESVIKRISVL